MLELPVLTVYGRVGARPCLEGTQRKRAPGTGMAHSQIVQETERRRRCTCCLPFTEIISNKPFKKLWR